ncbi:hypothetical protein ACRWQM_09120 [Shewanella sp. HL-SH5]|uniref:hypothetical protein n=1 Tax=Shewanella sp. HL-SH5 TaxID=3436241 RepID=UPI003EC02714
MRKSIFAISLSFNLLATALAVANPLSLFVDQCLQFDAESQVAIPNAWQLSSTTPYPPLTRSVSLNELVAFESSLLSLNNLNDRNNYYRRLTQQTEYQQNLLMCQVHLADELSWLLNQIDPQLLQADKASFKLSPHQQPYYWYLTSIQQLKNAKLNVDVKSMLHGLQTSIEYNLRQQYLFEANAECALETASESTKKSINNISTTAQNVARYLLLQPKSSCRQQAWLAYQGRAKEVNQTNLLVIHKIKTKQAKENGFADSADFQLKNSGLTVEQLSQFLNSQTENIQVAPWDLPHALKKQPKIATEIQTTAHFIDTVFEQLSLFSLNFERLSTSANTTDIYRVWHKKRLLGEIFLDINTGEAAQAVNVDYFTIKQSVIGQQLGQYALNVPFELTKVKQYDDLIFALSDIVNQLAKGSQFYYVNQQNISPLNQQLGTYWLATWLTSNLKLDHEPHPRAKLINSFKKQQLVFRSKVALLFYQQHDLSKFELYQPILNRMLSQSFEDSFGVPYLSASDAIFSYLAIANQGISYYLLLWQQTLAQLIYNESLSSSQAKAIFDVIVVNEHHQSLYDQLSAVFKQPMDFEHLLWRINYVGTKQE